MTHLEKQNIKYHQDLMRPTQLDRLNKEKKDLLQIIGDMEKYQYTDTAMYKYYKDRYYSVVSTIENIR